MSSLVREYATEALQAYNARLYRASAVMLGVASEAADVSCWPAKDAVGKSSAVALDRTA